MFTKFLSDVDRAIPRQQRAHRQNKSTKELTPAARIQQLNKNLKDVYRMAMVKKGYYSSPSVDNCIISIVSSCNCVHNIISFSRSLVIKTHFLDFADSLFDRLVNIIRMVELTMPEGKQCFPLAYTKGLGFANEYELDFILG